MTAQTIIWATDYDAYKIELSLTHTKPVIEFDSNATLTFKNVGFTGPSTGEFFYYTPSLPRILFRCFGDYAKPDPDGKSDMRGMFVFSGYAEVSGPDVVPDVINGTISYVRDIEGGLINYYAVPATAFHRRS